MSGERTVPLLPCRSVDEIAEFYTMLGFTRTYGQERPNPYAVMERGDLHLHFFGLPGLRPEDSYGSCLVVVPDIAEIFDAFAAGMRAVHGKLLVSGIPRMTRPRRRKNADGVTGFAVIDPGGNWIRFTAGADGAPAGPESGPGERRARGGAAQRRGHGRLARRPRAGRPSAGPRPAPARGHRRPAERVEALAYRAELAARAEGAPDVREFLDRAGRSPRRGGAAGLGRHPDRPSGPGGHPSCLTCPLRPAD